MIDLLETIEIKEAIKESPENVQQIIEDASMGVCITNSDGKFVTVNTKYCETYGYDKNELIGQDFTIVVPQDNQENMSNLHDKFIRDKSEIARNWTVVRKDGQQIEISVDTGYSEEIFDKTPHKITFVQKED